MTTRMSTTTIHATEMADLLNLLEDVVRCHGRVSPSNRQLASELRETIIAGTPLDQRTGSR